MDYFNEIHKKIINHERLDKTDGLKLLQSDNLLEIGYLANYIREQKNKNYVYFTHSLNINPTNICKNHCPLCAFAKDENDRKAYVLKLEEIIEKIKWAKLNGITEFHLVGGLNPKLDFSYYLKICQTIKSIFPEVFIQGFTATEIEFFSQITGLTEKEVLTQLKKVGLGSLPGGGAEIFSSRVRMLICPNKISAKQWLKIHQQAHQLGLKSNATMLCGHIETKEEQIDHLLALRDLQDKTNGFLAFVPLIFQPTNTKLEHLFSLTAYEILKIVAVARLILDNFSHLRFLPLYVGYKLAQIALEFGVDDLGGTSFEEKIAQSTQTLPSPTFTKTDLIDLIKKTCKIPVEVNSIYQKC